MDKNEYLALGNDSDMQAAKVVVRTLILAIGLDQKGLVLHAAAE